MTNPQSNYDFKDFPVGTKVKIICGGQDGYFWFGETGVVIRNTGNDLGIQVKLDKPRHFKIKDGYTQHEFGFTPTDLIPVVSVEHIRELVAERNRINQLDLKNICFTENEKEIDIPKDKIEEFLFFGLNNIDFITGEYYK